MWHNSQAVITHGVGWVDTNNNSIKSMILWSFFLKMEMRNSCVLTVGSGITCLFLHTMGLFYQTNIVQNSGCTPISTQNPNIQTSRQVSPCVHEFETDQCGDIFFISHHISAMAVQRDRKLFRYGFLNMLYLPIYLHQSLDILLLMSSSTGFDVTCVPLF